MYGFNFKKSMATLVCICSILGATWASTLLLTVDFDRQVLAQESKKDDFKPNVFNRYGRPIGGIDVDGNVYNRQGRSMGYVSARGTVYNVAEKCIGRVSPDGKVYNQLDKELGHVATDGRVFNRKGRLVGMVDAQGDVFLIGGAARSIFFNSRRKGFN